jgi:hypothetical protein
VYPNRRKRDGTLVRILNGRSRASLGDRIVLAMGIRSRLRGLLGRPGLAEGEGLWLEPCTSIHMFFMRFAIDVVFVDRNGIVVRPAQNVAPWRIAAGGRGTRAALELPIGSIARSGTRAGDRLEIEPA